LYMRITAYPFPAAVSEKRYFNNTVIVVDVLRASTSMVESLQNGAAQIIPARDAGEATAFAAHLGRKESLLAGENGGLKMQGFDLGNSPLEQSRDVVEGKTVVFCTTNGTAAIHAARNASMLLIGCLRNRTAVAKYAAGFPDDILLLCAGTNGECSIDDVVAVGGIYRALLDELGEDAQIENNDFAQVCLFMYTKWREGAFGISMAAHYRKLRELGFEKDLAFCLDQDRSACVPRYENGSLRNIMQ
ncbi:2-phosphosulfolactate phosphatase, partial [Christensenellaceae bacterium OttesenSCG-928-M15]|nr:2-phosphosulfolactate phosphatase [Christensenellaceae bacterium OttesenSCG-928-M15]